MKIITRQQEGSPNRNFCTMCGTYDIGSFESLCPECKRTQAIIDFNKPKE